MKHSLLLFLVLSTLPLSARADETISLFDGKSLAGWTDKKGGEPSKGWVVEDGALFRKEGGGDIYTKDEYGDFELSLEWKVAPKANSGIKYRMHRYANGSVLGPEYQVLDDKGHSNGKDPKTSAGSAYDLLAPSDDKELKSVGEWNSTKIVARGTKIEHWLNGKMILAFDTAGPEYTKAVAKSKFKDLDKFAQNPKGRIMLQDHGDQAWFRKITLKKLD
jgi:hypothetical protein